MDVKAAVRLAKTYVADLFAEDGIRDVGLEEVEFDDAAAEWHVTIGFARSFPFDPENPLSPRLSGPRDYKVVTIAPDARVKSVKQRMFAS